jgi:NAD-dependent deacetylase
VSADRERFIDALVERLARAQRILVFTGAGVSTGSGIPDFRGPNGVWQRRQPVYYDEFLSSDEKRREYWDYKVEGWDGFAAAKPNDAHRAIVTLERAGQLAALVTQNIDGLHQLAGSQDVIEVHGTNRMVECVECGARTAPAAAVDHFRKHQAVPKCDCGGWLKFATISFGQQLDPRVIDRAFAVARDEIDLVLSLGSTLSVQPAAMVPLEAVRRGAPYVVINQGPTEHDEIATLRGDGDVATLLAGAVAKLA